MHIYRYLCIIFTFKTIFFIEIISFYSVKKYI